MTTLEHSQTIKSSQMRLFILLADNPWLDSVHNHFIYNDPISHMDCFLEAKHA